jgi:hypothetical protein
MTVRNKRTESARVGTHLPAGFAVTPAAVALYSGYTVWQMRGPGLAMWDIHAV